MTFPNAVSADVRLCGHRAAWMVYAQSVPGGFIGSRIARTGFQPAGACVVVGTGHVVST